MNSNSPPFVESPLPSIGSELNTYSPQCTSGFGFGRPSETENNKIAGERGTSIENHLLFESSIVSMAVPLPRISTEDQLIQVWRFGQSISQSRLGGRRGGSHACTIIALSMADQVHRCDLRLPPMIPAPARPSPSSRHSHFTRAAARRYANGVSRRFQHCALREGSSNNHVISAKCVSVRLTDALVNCMIDGNQIHEMAMQFRKPTEINFTIPDAMVACGSVFGEVDFASVKGALWTQLVVHLQQALQRWHHLHRTGPLPTRFCMLVIAYERSVLVVYQPATETLGVIDSHSHSADGAVMAFTHVSCLAQFTQWITTNIFPECWLGLITLLDCSCGLWHDRENARNHEFEISALVHMDEQEVCATSSGSASSVLKRGSMFDRKQTSAGSQCASAVHSPCPCPPNPADTAAAAPNMVSTTVLGPSQSPAS